MEVTSCLSGEDIITPYTDTERDTFVYRIMVVMKVETDIIVIIRASPYVVNFKSDVIVFIHKIILCPPVCENISR